MEFDKKYVTSIDLLIADLLIDWSTEQLIDPLLELQI